MSISLPSFSAAILAAGRGTRISPLSLDLPKPLLPIANKPMIEHQIDAAKKLGINNFYIVVGYQQDKIRNYFGSGVKKRINITYIEQNNFIGIAHAVSILENYIRSPFFLFLGDIYADTSKIYEMIDIYTTKHAAAVIAVNKNSKPDEIRKNFSVTLSPRTGEVIQVVEKPKYINNKIKGCGIYLFTPQVFDAVRNTPRTAMRDEYELTTSIQIMVNSGMPVYAMDAISWDINVTTPEDLLRANMFFLQKVKKKNLIGKSFLSLPGTKVVNSVIGNRVKVLLPIKIVNSLIFNDVVVNYGGEIKNSIYTNGNLLSFQLSNYEI